MTTVWVDASSGASGDMLLGALVGAGVPVGTIQAAVDAIAPEPVTLRVEAVTRNGFAATRVHVDAADSVRHRGWRDIRTLLLESQLDDAVRDLAGHQTAERAPRRRNRHQIVDRTLRDAHRARSQLHTKAPEQGQAV